MNNNNMQYGHSGFEFRKQALIKARAPFDLTDETSVNKFIIGGTEPEGTARRIIFSIDDALFKFSDAGNLIPYEWRGEFEDVIINGNTVAELLNLQHANAFCGKKVFPVIALDAAADAPVMPKIKISLEVDSYNDIYTRYFYSPVYELSDNARVYQLSESEKFCNGHSTSLTECRILKNNGEWSDWQILPAAENTVGSKIQFRTNPILTTLDGSDEIKIGAVICKYTTNADISPADSFEIITLPQEYDADLKTFYALIKHDELIDAEIKAYVNISGVNKRRENIEIGAGTSETQTIILSDTNIAQDTLNITIDGVTTGDYYFDTGNSSITLTADSGAQIAASYLYEFAAENWHEMTQDFQDSVKTRFTYTAAEGGRVVSFKFVVKRQKGSASENLGAGNGKFQSYNLSHAATDIDCNAVFEYDEGAQILKAVAPIDEEIFCNYNWRGVQPVIHEFICGAAV